MAEEATNTDNLLLGVKGSILGTKVDAIYQRKSSNDVNIKEDNTTIKCNLIEGTFLVHGKKDPKAKEKSIAEFIAELKEKFSSNTKKEDIEGLVDVNGKGKNKKAGGKSILENLKLSIEEIYFVKKTASLSAKKEENKSKIETLLKNTSGKFEKNDATEKLAEKGYLVEEGGKYVDAKSKDYALWINLDIDKSLMDGFPITVENVSLKMWNTNNKVVLEEMKLTKMTKMLAAATVK